MLALRIGCALALLGLAACAAPAERQITVVQPPPITVSPAPLVLHPASPGSGQANVTFVDPPRYGDVTFAERPEVAVETLDDGPGWVLPD